MIWGNSQEHKLCHSSNWFCFSTFDNHHSSVLDWSFKVDNYLFWPFCKKYLFYSSITPPDCHKNQSYKNYRGCNKFQKWLQNRSSRHPQASIHHLNRFIAVFLFRATTIAWTEFVKTNGVLTNRQRDEVIVDKRPCGIEQATCKDQLVRWRKCPCDFPINCKLATMRMVVIMKGEIDCKYWEQLFRANGTVS